MPCRKLPGQARYRHHLVESDDAAIPGTFDLKVPFPRVPAIDGSEIRRRLAPPDYISSAFVHFRRQRRSPLQATDEIYTQAFRHLPLSSALDHLPDNCIRLQENMFMLLNICMLTILSIWGILDILGILGVLVFSVFFASCSFCHASAANSSAMDASPSNVELFESPRLHLLRQTTFLHL